MTMYDRIKSLRLSLKLSQSDLAMKMGYKDGSMITKIESGKVDISQKKIVAFAKALNTTPAYLMGWTDNPSEDYTDPRESETDHAEIHHPEIRLLASKLDRLPQEQRDQALDVFNAMYHKFFDRLEDEKK